MYVTFPLLSSEVEELTTLSKNKKNNNNTLLTTKEKTLSILENRKKTRS